MFDHLDDPQPYEPRPGALEAVQRRGRGIRRRRRAVGASVVVIGLLVVGGAGAVALVDRSLDDVERVDVAGAGDPVDPGGPQTVLFVGADSDDGLDPSRPSSRRADTIVLALVDPAARTLTVLPLPRDLWVSVPGHDAGRINGVLPLGGPSLLLAAIEQELGIEVDRYVETDFVGAAAIGDALGGLEVSFPAPVRDRSTGLAHPGGCARLDGRELLALGRSRHLEVQLPDGTWAGDRTSDRGRIERQQALAVATLARLAELDAGDPAELVAVVRAAAQHLTVDASMGNDELVALVRSLQDLEVVQLRLPVQDAVIGGAAVVELEAGAQEVVADLGGAVDGPFAGPGPDALDPIPVVPTPC